MSAVFLLAQSRGMPNGVGAVVIVGVLLLIVTIVIFATRAVRKARRELLEKLRQVGLTITEKPDLAMQTEAYALMRMKITKGERGVKMIARGIIRDRDTTLVEHMHMVHTGKSAHAVYWTFAIIACPEHWPQLVLSEEHLGDKIMKFFGKDRSDVQTESKAFDDRWRVECPDPDFGTLVLSPEVQAWANSLPRSSRVSIGAGQINIACRSLLSAKNVDAFVDAPSTLADLLPPELDAYGAA
ncbi:MAG: hypothetical protein JNL50_11620 [Phycisphaerae bacterium]|nr:hypothetical protein [Phycisphaerae bacterium]